MESIPVEVLANTLCRFLVARGGRHMEHILSGGWHSCRPIVRDLARCMQPLVQFGTVSRFCHEAVSRSSIWQSLHARLREHVRGWPNVPCRKTALRFAATHAQCCRTVVLCSLFSHAHRARCASVRLFAPTRTLGRTRVVILRRTGRYVTGLKVLGLGHTLDMFICHACKTCNTGGEIRRRGAFGCSCPTAPQLRMISPASLQRIGKYVAMNITRLELERQLRSQLKGLQKKTRARLRQRWRRHGRRRRRR